MSPTVALWFLFRVLFLLMNGHSSSGRDLKVEVGDQKQVDSHYITNYITTPDSTQHPYSASYKHNHDHPSKSHHGKVHEHEPYLTGYSITSAANEANQPYIAGHRTSTHDHDSNQPYITGYRSNLPHEKLANQPYIAGYGTNTHDSNQPYIAGYRTTLAQEKPNQLYIAGYRTRTTHDSNQPYVTEFAAYRTNTVPHEKANQPYITGYRTNQEPYITQYGDHPKESAQVSTKPDITQYGIGAKKDSKESAQDSGEQYITQYGNGHKKDPKESAPDSFKHYMTQYGDGAKKESKKSTQYITNYGTGPPQPKESTQNYIAAYKVKSEHADDGATKTEAFKTGFFTLDDLHVGNIMTLQFPVQEISHFLPRKEAGTLPFLMSQFPSVLQLFSIPEDSPEAQNMKNTLEQCEAEPITGETKVCVRSVESMLEFVDTIIGSETNNYDILTTSYPTSPSSVPLQKYTVLEVSQDIYAPKWVACHPLPYPYAVYYCHFIGTGSKVFKVLLGGEKGDKMEALGICHLDTSDWDPAHIVFKQLGIKAGEDPVCHFFPVKHLLWVPQPSKATM